MMYQNEDQRSHTKAARALLGWSQQDLAQRAGIAVSTVADFERGQRTPIPANLDAIKSALEHGGVQFLPGGAVLGRQMISRPVSGKGMPVRFVDVGDLSQWAERLDSKSKMPELISRLIGAEKGGAAKLVFPSAEAITDSGWDGYCEVEAGTQYIPAGRSGWEIGTQRTKIHSKADEDFAKRTAGLDAAERAKTTFVFVTPRRWPGKKKWVLQRKAEKSWADVLAYDANDLVHWIELFPAVGHWISTQVGKRPIGTRDLEEAWQEWSLSTKWPMNSAILLAGRDEQSASILRWLYGQPSVLTVKGDEPAEATAFLHAAIDQLPEGYREHYLYRCMVTDQSEAARRLGDSLTSLIIVVEDPEPGFAAQLAQKGHFVYAVTSNITNTDSGICLPRATRADFEQALLLMGMDKQRAESLARETARSLTVLRRLIPSVAGQKTPKWCEPAYASELIPALLAGAWDDQREGDRKALELLAGSPYEIIVEHLTPWLAAPDAPLKNAGSAWKIVSPLDAWFRLASHFSPAQMERFSSTVVQVLGSPDPRFKLDPNERWLAGIHGKEPSCSGLLRTGIAESLILLALYGDRLPAIQYAGRRAEAIVDSLLRDASAERWWSVSAQLRTLAEASPDGFLNAVDESLTLPEPPILDLFKEDGGALGGAHHSELLWALEMLAWDTRYLPRVSQLLARLARLDPGGKYANRPSGSLLSIFRLWMPQTNASLEMRLRVIEHLRKKESDISWKLLLALLPKSQDYATPSPLPRWRDFSSEQEEATWSVIRKGAEKLTEWILSDVGKSPERWISVIEHYSQFSPERRAETVKKLHELSLVLDDDHARRMVWHAIRAVLHHHRSFPDANWALPAAELDDLEQAYIRFEPPEGVEKWDWLFSHHRAKVPRPVPNDWQETDKLVESLRCKAVENLAQHGMESIFELARNAEIPVFVGHAVGQSSIDQQTKDAILRRALQSSEPSESALAHGLTVLLVVQQGTDWARALLENHAQEWVPAVAVRLLLALPSNPDTWELAAYLGEAVEMEYWKRVGIFQVDRAPRSVEFFITKLIGAKRPRDAAVFAAYEREKISSALILNVLSKASTPGEEPLDREDVSSFVFAIEELLQVLDKAEGIDRGEIATLEWSYLPLLEHSRRPPIVLHATMSSNPKFFVEVLSAAFHPASGERPELPPEEAERKRAIASHAYQLLHSWRKVPGENAGVIDGSVLAAWVTSARQLCRDCDRLTIGDQFIGGVCASSPSGTDGAWPSESVRELIETVRSRNLELGIEVAIHNNRGVTSRGLLDGGEQERTIATRYREYSKTTALGWPRTSALLERVAKSFEDDAKRYDNEAQRTDWSF